MKEIKLTQCKVALVDDNDFAWLNQWKWFAAKNKHNWHAQRGRAPSLLMHRLILNPPEGYQCDHINGDGLNNQRSNLRICTNSQNQQNRIHVRGTSCFKGVYWYKPNRKWRSLICLDGKHISLGCFDFEIAAAEAYNEAALKYFGQFARLNNIFV